MLWVVPVPAQLSATRATKRDSCGSQQFATVALGEALARVRASRLFATSAAQRKALAELEILMIDQLDAEPDSIFRGAAWLQVDHGVYLKSAEDYLDWIKGIADRAPSETQRSAYLRDQMARLYREELETVLKLVDPRTPKRCAASAWKRIHAAALRAHAADAST